MSDAGVLSDAVRRFDARTGGEFEAALQAPSLAALVNALEEAYLDAGHDELHDVLELLTGRFPDEAARRSFWLRRGRILEAVLPAGLATADEPLLVLHHIEPAGQLAFAYEVTVGGARFDVFHGFTEAEPGRLLRLMAPDGRDLRLLNSPTVFERDAILLKRRRSRPAPPQPAPEEPAAAPAVEATVLIPVFNDYGGLSRLLASLGASRARLSRLVIGFEPGARPAELVRDVEAVRPLFGDVELVEHAERQGFVLNCNALFERVSTDLFLLLTTDVELPRGWERRMFGALELPDVAAATPLATNGVNLTVPVPAGWNWREMDEVLAARPPAYPDACTTIGYALAGRRSRLPGGELFETAVENGYGEDSDLHYRVVQSGARAVVIDNLLVRHDGGSSFEAVPETAELQRRNRRWFFARWSDIYFEDLPAYVARGEVDEAIRGGVEAALARTDRRLDLVFVAPLVSVFSGGVAAIFHMEDACARAGLKTAVVLVLDSEDPPPRHVTPYPGLDPLLQAVEGVTRVVCTSNETVAAAQYLAGIYGADVAYFVQGPEVAFGGGASARPTLNDYAAADRHIVVSDYLIDYLQALGSPGARRIGYGPSTHVFFDRGQARQERSVVVHAGGALEKGPGLAALTAAVFLQAGWTVHVVGRKAGAGWPAGAIVHGHTPPWRLAELFNTTQYYVDTSIYEGLGLLLLECAFCGGVPVTLRNGGASGMVEAHSVGVLLDGPSALLDLPRSLPADYEAFRRERQRGVAALRESASLEAAYAQAPGLFGDRRAS